MTRTRRAFQDFIVLLLALCVTTCGGDASSIWKSVLAKCAAGDQVANVMFFSLSNDIGPGSIWRKTPNNGYIAVQLFDPTLPRAGKVIHSGVRASCAGVSVSTRDVKADVGVDKLLQLMPASASADLKRASAVKVSADGWAWDEVLEGPFRDMLSAVEEATPANSYLRDVRSVGLVVGRAVRVDGITAELSFARSTATELKGKYPTGISVSGTLAGTWTDSTSLKVTVTKPAYVAVQMYRWTPDGLSSKQLVVVALEKNASVVADSGR